MLRLLTESASFLAQLLQIINHFSMEHIPTSIFITRIYGNDTVKNGKSPVACSHNVGAVKEQRQKEICEIELEGKLMQSFVAWQ